MSPTTELAVEEGYEYGGGGPEYNDGLTSAGTDMLVTAEEERPWPYSAFSPLTFSNSKKLIPGRAMLKQSDQHNHKLAHRLNDRGPRSPI